MMKKLCSFFAYDSHLGARVGLSLGLLVAILVAIGLIEVRHLRRVDADLAEMDDQRWNKVKLSRQAQALSNLNNRLTMQVFLVEDKKEVRSLMLERAANSDRISSLIEKLRTRADSNEEKGLLSAIETMRSPYVDSYKSALRLLTIDNSPDAARAVLVQQALPRLVDYHAAWDAYVDYQGRQMDLAQETNAASGVAARRTMMFLVALGVLFAGAIGIFVMRNIAWHVNNSKHSEEALRSAHDELDDRVQQRTADLARANGALELEVAERKNAEAGLRESEERYRDLFENANDIIYTHDLEGNYTSINKTCEKIVGYTNEEALKMNIAQVVAPEYLEETWQLLARKTRGKTPSAYVLEVIAKDGHRVVLEVNSRLTHEHGKPTGVQGIARDITERKRIERKLKNSELQLNEAQRIAHVGSWEFEAATQELRWTDELWRIFGLEAREFGLPFEEFLSLVHPDDHLVRAPDHAALLRGKRALRRPCGRSPRCRLRLRASAAPRRQREGGDERCDPGGSQCQICQAPSRINGIRLPREATPVTSSSELPIMTSRCVDERFTPRAGVSDRVPPKPLPNAMWAAAFSSRSVL